MGQLTLQTPTLGGSGFRAWSRGVEFRIGAYDVYIYIYTVDKVQCLGFGS